MEREERERGKSEGEEKDWMTEIREEFGSKTSFTSFKSTLNSVSPLLKFLNSKHFSSNKNLKRTCSAFLPFVVNILNLSFPSSFGPKRKVFEKEEEKW